MKHIKLFETHDAYVVSKSSPMSTSSNIVVVDGWDYSTGEVKKSLGDGIYVDLEFTTPNQLKSMLSSSSSNSKIFLYGRENASPEINQIIRNIPNFTGIDLEFIQPGDDILKKFKIL